MYTEKQKGHGRKQDELVIFFHGFPGRTTKNEDVFNFVNEKLGYSTHLFHYKGLGRSKGHFSFLSSIEFSISLAKKLSNDFKKIHIIGHSWGGLVGVNAFCNVDEQKRGALILLNPLVKIPGQEQILGIVKNSFENGGLRKDDYTAEDLVMLSKEAIRIASDYGIDKSIGKLLEFGASVYFLLSKNDDVTSMEHALPIVRTLTANQIIFNDDHWLSHRNELIDAINHILKP